MNRFFLIFFLVVLFLFNYSYTAWIAKIDKKVIDSEDFQDFIDYSKYVLEVAGEGTQKIDQKSLNSMLTQYIDNELILLEAANKKITFDSIPLFKQEYETQREKWVGQVYLSTHLKIKGIKASSKEVESEFNKLKQSGVYNIPAKTTFKSISSDLKGQLKQKIMIDKVNQLKDKYRMELEKEHDVKRMGLDDVYVAIVDGVNIPRTDVLSLLQGQLSIAGMTIESLSKNKVEYDRYRTIILNDLILNEMIQNRIKKEKFDQKSNIKLAYGFIKKQIVLQYFLKEEIYDKIKITSSEKDVFYKKNKEKLKQQPFDQVKAYIDSSIRQGKAKDALLQFINEKKEMYVIRRNMEELKNIKI